VRNVKSVYRSAGVASGAEVEEEGAITKVTSMRLLCENPGVFVVIRFQEPERLIHGSLEGARQHSKSVSKESEFCGILCGDAKINEPVK
jgi:hypothetical protein